MTPCGWQRRVSLDSFGNFRLQFLALEVPAKRPVDIDQFTADILFISAGHGFLLSFHLLLLFLFPFVGLLYLIKFSFSLNYLLCQFSVSAPYLAAYVSPGSI